MSIRASPTAELIFEDCFVPTENRLGNEGQDLKIALDAIYGCRTSVAAMAVGIAQGAFDKALAYAQKRQQQGTDEIQRLTIARQLLRGS